MARRRRAATQDTLQRQLRVTLSAAGALLLVIVISAVYSLVQVITYQTRVTDLYFQAIGYSNTLIAWTDDAGRSVRSYLSTGDESTLDPLLFDRQTRHDEVRAALVTDYGADASVVVALDDVSAALDAWVSQFARPAIGLVREEGPGTVPPDLVAEGDRLLTDLRGEALDLADELTQGREVADHELSEWTRNLFLTVVLLTVAALAVALGIWYTLRRRILDPLGELAEKAEAVSAGSLDQQVTTSGPGEIAWLAHAVESMRVELVDQMAAARRSEAEIAQAHEQVVDQAEELRRSNRDLEQFAYVASHDLQEPLRKVASFTQLLQKRYGGELDERADQYIEFAVDGAKRMQRLIQDLLGFSRVGRSVGAPVPVDLAAACATAVATFDTTIEETGAVVEVGPLPVVTGQQTLLLQLFQNLVGNALKFRSPDRAPYVRIGSVRREHAWELWCSDNGIGIDAQYADRVFVIFQRLHAKDVYEGTGIGLALCKKIVEHHGGEIWLDVPVPTGEDGPPPSTSQGTTIRWTIPDPASAPAGVTPLAVLTGGPARVRLDPQPIGSPVTDGAEQAAPIVRAAGADGKENT